MTLYAPSYIRHLYYCIFKVTDVHVLQESWVRKQYIWSLVDLGLQSLASAIAATKVLSAQQVVKNEAGEEVSNGYRLFEYPQRMNRELVWVHVGFWTSLLLTHFFRFSSHWTHLEWRCSKTQLYQTTSQRRRAQRRRSTEQSPALQRRKILVGAGSTLRPVSSPKHSTGETGPVWFIEIQWWKSVLKEFLCVTGVDSTGCQRTAGHRVGFVCVIWASPTCHHFWWKTCQHVQEHFSFYLCCAKLNGGKLEKCVCFWTFYPLFSWNVNIFCRTSQTSIFSLRVKKIFFLLFYAVRKGFFLCILLSVANCILYAKINLQNVNFLWKFPFLSVFWIKIITIPHQRVGNQFKKFYLLAKQYSCNSCTVISV